MYNDDNSSSSQSLTFFSHPNDWAMMRAHNLSMDDLLQSLGFAADARWFEPPLELCLVLSFSLAVCLGLLGNAALAFLLCRRGNLTSPRHGFLFNLVLSDILTCVFCVPFTLLRLLLKNWPLGQALCRVAPFLQLTYVFVSVFTILAISVQRYRSIVCPSRPLAADSTHRRLTARGVIPGIWVLASLLALPAALHHRLEHVRNVTGEVLTTLCIEEWGSEALLGAYTVLLLLCQYALPAASIVALHLLICRFLRARVHLRLHAKKSRRKLGRHRKNLVLLTTISLTFALQWLPITVVNIMADFDMDVFPSARAFCLTYALCLLFALSAVFVNPVLYGCFNSNIRRDILALCNISSGAAGSDSTSATRAVSSEATSRYYTTMVGSLGGAGAGGGGGVSRHHSLVDGGFLLDPSAAGVTKAGRKQRMSVDAVLHVTSPSTEVLQRLVKQRTSLQVELRCTSGPQ